MFIYYILFFYLMTSYVAGEDVKNKFPSPRWYYSADGEEKWPGNCNGLNQSPIDISDYDTVISKSTKIDLMNYDRMKKFTAINNGHTVNFKLDPQNECYITGGNTIGKYKLTQIHFHWKSEHTLNGKRYPLEAHFVHGPVYTRNRRDSSSSNSEKFHVLAVLFYINKANNSALNEFFADAKRFVEIGSNGGIKLNPRSLLPRDTAEFYGYDGSLTTPDCTETVRWTIFQSKIPISDEQLASFRRIETLNGTNVDNYRRTKPLNGRTVIAYDAHASAADLRFAPALLLFAIIHYCHCIV